MLIIFLGRLLKHLAAMESIYETGPNQYVPTPLSKALSEPIYRDAYPTMFVLPRSLFCYSIHCGTKCFVRFGICGPSFFVLPEYLSKSQYKDPDNPTDGAFQLGHDTKSHFFEWVSQRPELLTQFQYHMAGYRIG